MKRFLMFRALFFLSLAFMPLAQSAYADSRPLPVLPELSQAELKVSEIKKQVSDIRDYYGGAGKVPDAVEEKLKQTEASLREVDGLAGEDRVLSNQPGVTPEQKRAIAADTKRAMSELEQNFSSAVDTANANPSPKELPDTPPEPALDEEPEESTPSSGTEETPKGADEPTEDAKDDADLDPEFQPEEEELAPLIPLFQPNSLPAGSAAEEDPFSSTVGVGGSGGGAGAGGAGGIAQKEKDKILRWGVCRLYASVEGGMGGLFATIAGVLAIIFSVVGAFKAAWGFLLVAVGSFILRSLISLFYGNSDFSGCESQIGGRGPVPAVAAAPYDPSP